MAILEAVFANKPGQTPQEVERRRRMAQALVEAGSGGKPPASGLELAGRLAMTLTGQYQAGKAERQDATNRADANSLLAKTLLGSSETSGFDPSVNSPAPANSPAASSGPQSYRDAIAGIESAGSGDYSAVGPTHPKMGRALGRYQIMESNIGPWSQETLGRAVTPEEFMADPKLQDAIFDKKFGTYVQQYGPQGAAQAWFAGPGGVGKLDRKDSLGTSVGAYGDKFINALGGGQQVASLDPSAGMGGPGTQPPQPLDTQQAGPPRAPMQGPTQAAPALAPPTTIANAPPVASVQSSLMAPPAQSQPQAPQVLAQAAPNKRAQIAALLQNPYTQEMGQQMLMQEYQQQQEEQKWRAREDYKLNTQRADPSYKLEQDYKQAQLDALKAKTGKRANVTNLGDGWLWDNDEKKAFRPQDETDKPNSGFRFGGNSVEAQALNGLIESGQITADQAQQLGAGKTITDPSTGAMMFLTPQGIFKQQQGQQGTPQAQQQPSIDLFGDGGANIPSSPAAPPAALPATPLPPPANPNAPAPQTSDAVSGNNPGIIPLTGGKPQKLLSEAERKNQSLFSVIKPELQVVEDNYDALTDTKNQAYSKLPFSEFATTPEYQKAANSLQTIVSSYLYSVSGATATPEEVRKQTDILTPRPGESKESIENKKRRVRTMVNAVAQAGSLPPLEEPAAAPEAGNSADIQAARDAIARGAPRDKVIQRLKDANIDPSGL